MSLILMVKHLTETNVNRFTLAYFQDIAQYNLHKNRSHLLIIKAGNNSRDLLGQLSLASLRGRLIEYQLRLG